MDRLAVFRALGDPTRYAIYRLLASSPEPRSTAELSAALNLHPNTLRPHLERLREAGLLTVECSSRGSVGRPPHRYRPADAMPLAGGGPNALLADLAVEVACALGAAEGRCPGVEAVASGIGRERGREVGVRQAGAGAGGRENGVRAREGSGGGAARCVEVLAAGLAELGFESESGAPSPEADRRAGRAGRVVTVSFTRCPYHELAAAHPEVVCELHRGLVEGIVDSCGGAAVEHFATLADSDPCHVELVLA